jgi:hypothetical protein
VATDAAYVTLENSRNNDNGTVAADIATDKSVKIRNVTTNGTFNEAARNSGASADIIKTGETIKQLNIDYVGTYGGGGGVPAPSAPSTVTVLPRSDTELTISWSFVSTATGFDVYRATSSGGSFSKINGANPVTTLSYTDTGRTAETAYFYKIKAKNGTGDSSFSAEATNTTEAADCISSKISANIATTLANITVANGYKATVVTVEMERISERLNDDNTTPRLPLIEICGPAIRLDRNSVHAVTGSDYADIQYVIVWKELVNDETLSDEPATKLMDNRAADMIKALMADQSRGGYGIETVPTDVYYSIALTDNNLPLFCTNVEFSIKTLIDSINPYLKG